MKGLNKITNVIYIKLIMLIKIKKGGFYSPFILLLVILNVKN